MTNQKWNGRAIRLCAATLILTAAPALADTLHVPSEYTTIQAAIDAAQAGDVVEIADGTYTGTGNKDLDFGGKVITVRGASDDPALCIIDCEGDPNSPHRGFYFHSGEASDSVIVGLKIINGYGPFETFGEDVVSVGGAVMCRYGSDPTFMGCIFGDCYAEGGGLVGGPEPGFGGGAVYSRFSSPRFQRCIFHNNETGDDGGAISAYAGDPLIEDCIMSGNFALDAGGAIYCRSSANPTLINVLVENNVSGFVGGGIFNRDGGVATLVNCAFVNNNAEMGGGLRSTNNASAAVTNCIFWGNTAVEFPQIAEVYGAIVTASYCDIEGGWTGEGNIDADPLFVDPDGPDDDPNTWQDNDYHLAPLSPCIDAGDNTAVPADVFDLDEDSDTDEPTPFDLDGNPRFVDDLTIDDTGVGEPPIVDMGAYEFTPGDLDGDGIVNLNDLAELLGRYGSCAGEPLYGVSADFDASGCIDLSDLAYLLGYYGTGT